MGVSFLNNIDGKNSAIKQKILGLCITEGDYSIADLSKELNSSIPTITKLVGELINEGYLEDMGKQGTNGGRRPSIYGLNPSAGYFVGVDIRRDDLSIAVTNFKGQTIMSQVDTDYTLEATEESFRGLCELILNYLKSAKIDTEKVNAYGINLTGRVNNNSGYSFSYLIGYVRPLS